MKEDNPEEDKRAKWEEAEIDDFAEEGRDPAGDAENERVVVSSYYQKGCYPMPYGMTMCNPRKGVCRPRGYGCYPWQVHCAPRHGCYPYFYYGGHGTYCRPYGFNYGYGCYPRR